MSLNIVEINHIYIHFISSMASLQVLGTGVGGPANPFQGIQQAKDSIRTAAELALIDAGLPTSRMAAYTL